MADAPPGKASLHGFCEGCGGANSPSNLSSRSLSRRLYSSSAPNLSSYSENLCPTSPTSIAKPVQMLPGTNLPVLRSRLCFAPHRHRRIPFTRQTCLFDPSRQLFAGVFLFLTQIPPLTPLSPSPFSGFPGLVSSRGTACRARPLLVTGSIL